MRINSYSSVRCHSDWKLLCISSSGSKEKGIWTSNVEMLSFQDFYLEILSIPTFQWVEGNDKAVNHHCNSENSKIPTVPQDSRSKSFSFPVRNSQRFLKYKAAKCFPPNIRIFVCFVFDFPSIIIKSLKSIFHFAFYSVYTDTQK